MSEIRTVSEEFNHFFYYYSFTQSIHYCRSTKYSGKCVKFEDDEKENNKREVTMHKFFSKEENIKTIQFLLAVNSTLKLDEIEKFHNLFDSKYFAYFSNKNIM